MTTSNKVSISLDPEQSEWMEKLLVAGEYSTRSALIKAAVVELQRRHEQEALETDLDGLDPEEEKALADEFLGAFCDLSEDDVFELESSEGLQ